MDPAQSCSPGDRQRSAQSSAIAPVRKETGMLQLETSVHTKHSSPCTAYRRRTSQQVTAALFRLETVPTVRRLERKIFPEAATGTRARRPTSPQLSEACENEKL